MTKEKKTKIMDTCCAPVCNYKPRLYLDLEGSDVAQLKGLKVGDEGMFNVRGKIVGLEQRERKDEGTDEKLKTTGSIQLEDYEVDVMGEENNEYKKMAEDD